MTEPESTSQNGTMPPGVRRPIGTAWAAWTAAGIIMVIALVSTVTIGRQRVLVPASSGNNTKAVVVNPDQSGGDNSNPVADASAAADNGGGGSGSGSGSGGTKTSGGGVANPKGLKCAAGQNGGSTDTGVSGNEIKLASTVVKSGIGKSFLGDVEFGMLAQMNAVNRTGGICGRQLSVKLVDDGWDPTKGQQYIRTFINEGYFALAVVPSSEGLRQAIDGGDVDRASIPVVGTDGMLIDQYTDPWVWPVAASTNSFMHIIAKNAYDRGARTFAIVYDQQYRFGVEGNAAYLGAIKRLGGNIDQSNCDLGINAGQPSYNPTGFNQSCGNADFVALLLEPETAATWIQDGGYLGTSGKALGVGGPQTLFTYNFGTNFASDCPSPCRAHFWVWTSFKPPLPPYDSEPAVGQYINDMNSENQSADKQNQFVEGGYDGMELLIKGMQAVGPNLTRSALQHQLDNMTYDSGLATARTFRAGGHFANVSAQAFSIVLNGSSFANFRYEQTGWVQDPWVGQDRTS